MAEQGLLIPQHYWRAFSLNWGHTVQQTNAKVANKVYMDKYEGKEKVYTDIDKVSFVQRLGRLTKSDPLEVTGDKRKSIKTSWKSQRIFDRDDKNFLGMLGLPQSELMEEFKYAWQRTLDDGWIAAATGTVYGGVDPYVTPITLPSTQNVAVDFVTVGSQVNIGMTPDKLMRSIKLFEDAQLSLEEGEFWLAMGTKQKEDLFQYVKTSPNAPYANMIGDWLNNPTKKLFGYNVVISTRLALNTSTDVRTCIAWKSDGIFCDPGATQVKIDERADLDHALQLCVYSEYSFMRRYEEKVVRILCDESP